MKLFLFLLSSVSFLIFAQPVRFGVRGGTTLTNHTLYSAEESKPYTMGPVVEFALPGPFTLDTGFLAKFSGTSYRFAYGEGDVGVRMRSTTFEIPVVGKYHFRPNARWTPFLGLGVSLRRSLEEVRTTSTGTLPDTIVPGNYHMDSVSPWGVGAVGAAGLKIRTGRLEFSPEFRYTRWSRESQRLPRNPNQVEFLVGVTF